MLRDRYDQPLSTTSSSARDAYVQGCQAKLTMYPGAIEAFDRAIVADPGFALAHAAKTHALLEHGDAAAAREAMAAASPSLPACPRGIQPRRVFRPADNGRDRSRPGRGASPPGHLAA